MAVLYAREEVSATTSAPTFTPTQLLKPIPEANHNIVISTTPQPIDYGFNPTPSEIAALAPTASAQPITEDLKEELDELDLVSILPVASATASPVGDVVTTITAAPTEGGSIIVTSDHFGRKGLELEQILGIIFGVLAAVALFGFIGWLGWKRRALRRKRQGEAQRAGRQIEEGRMAEKNGMGERDMRGARELKFGDGNGGLAAGKEGSSVGKGAEGKRSVERWVDVNVV
ncbi:hypothetical protein BJ508DRAFT_309465 [Ascobolus immersus RN42]|uniref:Uncharacterized protein n=1 Tax=Ascobolus immersus RN42 TaxID=1160509 RepID=A0A3N4I0I0_ASCIM|nr:hypothetical protein BJ508DRAFT_309465 [Ascobolus immersus RN42]